MIQEYYLHLLCGVSGEHDQYTGTGRLAIAALMAGYGLGASTKKDLQTRVNWRVTPGCFLGQKELSPDGYAARNYEELKFALALVPFRKVNRAMNYQLDWSAIQGEWDYRVTSPVWINLAKIYWLGYFFFGRNVIPTEVQATLRELFNPTAHEQAGQRTSLKSPFVMQFMKNIALPLDRVRATHLFTERQEDLPREDIFASLTMVMNFTENASGFYTCATLLGTRIARGERLDTGAEEALRDFSQMRPGRSAGYNLPLLQGYYYNYGLGRPAIPQSPTRMPTTGREIVPLLYCDNTRSPQQEQSSNFVQVRGEGFNHEYLSYNIQAWMTGAMLWEYNLLLTGRPLFPLEHLVNARQTKGWTEEFIIDSLLYLNPANNKNSSLSQIVRFNLERQSQV